MEGRGSKTGGTEMKMGYGGADGRSGREGGG